MRECIFVLPQAHNTSKPGGTAFTSFRVTLWDRRVLFLGAGARHISFLPRPVLCGPLALLTVCSVLHFAPISKWVSSSKVLRGVVRRLGKGMKSSRQDKREATKDTLKGVAKEATGALKGDDTKRAKGLSDQRKGAVKRKKGELKDRFK